MRFYPLISLICCLGFLPIGRIAQANAQEAHIVIDGSFDDWKDITHAVLDPVDSPNAEIDLGRISITDNGQFIHLLVELGREVNIQKLDGSLHLIFDIDAREDSGQLFMGLLGADIDIILSPHDPNQPNKSIGGVDVVSFSQIFADITPYTIGFTFGPTYASNQFELRISRNLQSPSLAPLFSHKHLRFKIVYESAQDNLHDETAIIFHELSPLTQSSIVQDQDPLNKTDGAIRVVNWNIKDGSIFNTPDPFVRCLNALSPDVILFQELAANNSSSQLQDFLNENLRLRDSQSWNVVFGLGGGNLRCAIASTNPLQIQEHFTLVEYPDWPDHSLRATGAIIELSGKRILCVSVHLRCCGRSGSRQDFTRVLEAETIRYWLAIALQNEQFDGVIVAGDFNLVGSSRPLDLLTDHLDIPSLTLAPVDGQQIDELSNATWSDSNESYVPGRLDFLLYSIGKLQIARSFVLDTHDLAPKWLNHHSLKATDTSLASDHLPLVADIQLAQ